MRVFLSWSGERSRYVAEQFSDWLPVVIQSVDTFMSEHDVEAGNRWAREIDDHLEATDFGILFVTPENQEAPWLVHEAGALGKSVEESRVVPVTIDMEPADVGWPLARFQGVELEEDGVRDLVNSVNSALHEDQLEPDILETAFDTNWSNLQEDLQDIPPLPEDPTTEDTQEEAQRKRDEKLDEVLELVRSLTRRNKIDDVLDQIDRLERKLPHSQRGLRRDSTRASRLKEILTSPSFTTESKYTLRGNPEDIFLRFEQEEFPHALTPIASDVEQSRIDQAEEEPGNAKLIVEHDADEEFLNAVVAQAADAAGIEILNIDHETN